MPADRIAELLVRAWPDVEVGSPTPLSGGYWATMYRVPVDRAPVGVPAEVVVRLAPHPEMGAKEAEVQRAVAAQAFPTPAVWFSGPDTPTDGWWSVMEFCDGAPLLAGLDAVAVLRRGRRLLRTLPVQLAETMAALHRLDPEPVTAAVAAVAPDVAWSAPAVLDHLRAGAAATGLDDVVAALDRLAARPPAPNPGRVCHGDLHPFNILDRDGELIVLDWTGAVVADPCFDIAFTELLLANPPLPLPRALAPVGRAVGRILARRFVDAYARAAPTVALVDLGWFRALHSARILVEVARLDAVGGSAGGSHPFGLIAPAAARTLGAETGVEVGSGPTASSRR